jgi:predicted TIM-barrel fold metal-dependent hydrolase
VKRTLVAAILFAFPFSACTRGAPGQQNIDPGILAEVNRTRAIDTHAHPVRFVAAGEADREFDALPVDSMEPASDPLQIRPDDPYLLEAWRALWNYPYNDTAPQHINEWKERKQNTAKPKGDSYPSWVLDSAGIDIMLANRVHMGTSVQPPRFLWVPYVDALVFPLDNSHLAAQNSDRKSFFALEDGVRRQYLKESGLESLPNTLDDYLRMVVTAALERHKQGGAVAEKFEIAYLRPFGFEKVERATAAKVYSTYANGKHAPPDDEYKALQDFLFRYIAAECGRLGLVVHIHTFAGAGSYFDVTGGNPLRLEPVFNDPELRKTKFVLVHGGWPFTREVTPLLYKPNVYLDYSLQSLLLTAPTLAQNIREWLEWVPEKVLFGTDGYPYSDALGWEETTWISAKRGREALAIALTRMLQDQEIPRDRALTLARMVLRDNARALYGL